MSTNTRLSSDEVSSLLATLQDRFNKHPKRHLDITWDTVTDALQRYPDKLWSLQQMELTGGEPDVVTLSIHTDRIAFVDCAAQSPSGRRSLCYDQAAHESRKTFKPSGSACGNANTMGITLLTAEEYAELQQHGEFDTTTSSWLLTPEEIRSRGGAIFGDRRYDSIFTYHNGAESYYAARGFRGILLI